METTQSTPITDLLSSLIFGGVFGFSVFLLLDTASITDQMFRAIELTSVRGRIEGGEFAVLGALLGVILDLLGKLTA